MHYRHLEMGHHHLRPILGRRQIMALRLTAGHHWITGR
jgi:hypothetical protein